MRRNSDLYMMTAMMMVLAATSSCSNTEPMSVEDYRDEFIEKSVYMTEHNVYRTYGVDGATPNLGIRYDNGGKKLSAEDEEQLEIIAENVYACLDGFFPDGKIPNSLRSEAFCYRQGDLYRQGYSEFVVVIDHRWRKSCRTDEQVLIDATVPPGVQSTKYKDDDGVECPTTWRALFRRANDGTSLYITTPSMYMLSDALTRRMTGCGNPWNAEARPPIIECARPIVPAWPE